MLRGVILLAWLASLAINAPGHLSYDSVMQLAEGRTGIYEGYHPPFMSALLGLFDRMVPGTALYLLFTSALFYVPLMVLAGGDTGRRPLNWIWGGLLALALGAPFLLIYQGIVWKDVLFANLALSTFTCLVAAERQRNRRAVRLGCLLLAALLAAFAAATRQNGLVVPLLAALAIGLRTPSPALRTRLAAGCLWLLAAACATLGTQALVQASAAQPVGGGFGASLTALRQYDMIGMIAHGARPYGAAQAATPESQRIEAAFRRDYEASRLDRVIVTPDVVAYFRQVPTDTGAWWRMVRDHPGAWLTHRAAVFRWMLLPPDIGLCLPVWVGLSGPPDTMAALGLNTAPRPQDAALYAYAARWFGTPLFINGAWALLSLVLGGLLCRRRQPGDAAGATLLAAALAFAATFSLIGIACDVRYLFLLPVACCGALALLSAAPAPEPPSVGQ